MNRPRASSWLGGAYAIAYALLGGCSPSQAASGTPERKPPGQVWMSAQQVADAKIRVATIGDQVVDDSVLTSGIVTLEDTRTGHVFSPVTGRVVKINAEYGQRVKKGDVLTVLESPDIGSAVSDSHKAQADLIAAEHDLRRKNELFEQHAASAADVEAAEDIRRTAKAELERARAKQFLLHVGNVDAVTQTFVLASPVDGEVLMRNINPGIEVQGQYSGGANQELFTIGELDRVWVFGDVYEIDMPRVHVDAPAQVTLLAYPGRAFDGKVDWISGSLDPNTRTAKVRCTFDNPDRALRPSMYTRVRIGVDERKALAIPREALVRMGEYKMVFVELPDQAGQSGFERVPIDIDEQDTRPWLQVKHGLDAGQKVVVSGTEVLSQKL
jgi:cobalt-zinc-cadmium efflux system membrane fusion protein